MNRAEKRRQKKLTEKSARAAKRRQAIPVPSAQSQSPTLQHILTLGAEHHKAGDLSKAETLYRQVLQADPNRPDALHLLGVVAHQKGNNEVAVELIGKALTIKPDDAVAHSNRGAAFRVLGQSKKAVEHYRKSIALDPGNAGTYFNLGNALKSLGESEDAVVAYRQALSLRPDYSDAHCNLGSVLQAQGLSAEAIQCYQNALSLKPDYAEASYNIGVALQEQGKPSEAMARYLDAINAKPNYAEAHNNLGALLQQQGKRNEAVTRYRHAISVQPENADAHSNLGAILNLQGKYDAAIASFTAAIDLNPNLSEAYCGLGLSHHYLGHLVEAKQAYKFSAALNGQPGLAQVGLRRLGFDEGELKGPAGQVFDNQKYNEKAHPGLRIWNRPVENALTEVLYQLPVLTPEEEMTSGFSKDRYSSGIRRGNMNISDNYEILNLGSPVIKNLRDDMIKSLSSLLNADIFISESFFNIYHAGSQAAPHDHILDGVDKKLGFSSQKFSLIYYVDAGDKRAKEPGILKLYNPDFSVNPEAGDVVLFPSRTVHSTSYSGETDRIILGINLYTY